MRKFPCQLVANTRLVSLALAVAILAGCGGANEPERSATQSAAEPAATRPGPFGSDKIAIGLANEPYLAELAPEGDVPPHRYRLVEGALPDGLTLDPDKGEIRGRPARPGTSHFVLEAVDREGRRTRQAYEVFIDESAGVAHQAPGQGLGKGKDRRALSATPQGEPDLSSLLARVAAMPEGSWLRVNLNAYSDVWTPADLRPMFGKGNPTPHAIIEAWSGFAWDTRRGSLFLYGGGHANYRGNDTYVWQGSTQRWERASLPSEMVKTPLGLYNAIDGASNAPASAHTYDNTNYLPRLDRMLVLGGAADPNGSHYYTQDTPTTKRITGPYLFDPSRAHPDRVGGTTGSHVQRAGPYPEVVGGAMWQNRESWLNASAASTPPADVLSNGCTGQAEESGKDVVYVRSPYRLYRYEIGDPSDPSSDRWSQVGRFYYAGSGTKASCAYDPVRKFFVSTLPRPAQPFVFWDLHAAGAGNRDIMVTPEDASGTFMPLISSGEIDIRQCGFDRDPVRDNFRLWCGGGRVWTLKPPSTPTATGWTIVQEPAPLGAVPTDSIGTGILGKWKYIENLDVFMGLLDAVQGNIWVYKPIGWTNPGSGNLAPSVTLTVPRDGERFTVGAEIALTADAFDGDGSIARVEFFAGATFLGERTAAPYGILWSGGGVGPHVLTARATDDQGASRTSAAVTISIDPVPSSNEPPTVAWVSPADGTEVVFGTPVTLEAAASDVDGSVVRVEYFSGASKVGEATVAPFKFVWTLPPLGAHQLTAIATDDDGETASSEPHTLVVTQGSSGMVTLQRGVGGAVVADTYLSTYHQTLNFGSANNTIDEKQRYSSLYRFAIFQSEGGPVPDGAQVTSAVLSLYKYSAYNMDYALHRVLQDWSEGSATWQQRMPGLPWATPGANSQGADIAAVPESTASVGWDPGWLNFDVTTAVQNMSGAPGSNRGWRLMGTGGYVNGGKKFYTSDFSGAPELRPKLVISYQ